MEVRLPNKVRFGATTALKRKEVRMLHPWSITNTLCRHPRSGEVVGQNWSSEVISLFNGSDWEVGRVALSCHLSVDLRIVPRNEKCVQGELRVSTRMEVFVKEV